MTITTTTTTTAAAAAATTTTNSNRNRNRNHTHNTTAILSITETAIVIPNIYHYKNKYDSKQTQKLQPESSQFLTAWLLAHTIEFALFRVQFHPRWPRVQ